MNLLHDPWMPVRDADGQRHWITPCRLADLQWRAFDADRPDFNGALAQFAIGLLQTTTPVADSIEWRRLFNAPPDSATLQGWFAPVASAFELDGDGPRFMQDRYLTPMLGKKTGKQRDEDAGGAESIQQLLIDCAGEGEKTDNNTDLFVKRKSARYGLCEACSALALYTLQSSAPGGGRGYLVSIRGGGPLTTLVRSAKNQPLWKDLWLNVMDRSQFDSSAVRTQEKDLRLTFPWLADLRFLQPGGISTLQFEGPKGGPKPTEEEKPRLQPSQVNPAHVFWGMPRRVKLDFSSCAIGACDVCGKNDLRLVSQYLTKNYGLNYKGAWMHPLSPYFESKDGWLPVHPQPDGVGYWHWLGWVLGTSRKGDSTRPAQAVDRALTLSHRQTGGALRLWAFGYDMDNMKARCWYDATLPLYELGDCMPDARSDVQAEAGRWIEATDLAADYLLSAVRDSWFAELPKSKAANSKKLGFTKAGFWAATESDFYRHLQTLIEAARSGTEHPALPVREAWHTTLRNTALRLFDQSFVGAGAIERQNPRRIALAHKQLRNSLHGPKLRSALGLPVDELKPKPPRKSASTKGPAREAA